MEAGIYKHYKGGYYQVLGVAAHSETDEMMVVYVSLTGIEMPGATSKSTSLARAEWLPDRRLSEAAIRRHGDH